MNSCSFFALLLFGLTVSSELCQAYLVREMAPLVTVKQGFMVGLQEKTLTGRTFYSYKNIPFAEPPVGKLRFKDPVPVKPWWPKAYDATKDSNFCWQKLQYENNTDPKNSHYIYAKEDCLYLNVYTPKRRLADSLLPVIFYIHGGSFILGGAQKEPPYVLMDKDIILVVIQYRLGIFGFLSTEDSVMPGNMGLKDQNMALRWVKENILAFGGDPESITLMGESAGAASVHFQILSPYSKGLFKNAIIQSGSALSPWAMAKNHREFAMKVGENFNCFGDQGTEAFVECLQTVDAQDLFQFDFDAIVWLYSPIHVLPRVDGDFVPDFPEILMKEGRYNKVENILSGVTKDEGAYMIQMFYQYPIMVEQLNNDFDTYGPILLFMNYEENRVELARQSFQFYLQRENIEIELGRDDDQLLKLITDRFIYTPYEVMTNFHMRDNIPLYLYQLNYVGKELSTLSPTPEVNDRNWVCHADELIYLFSGGPLITTVIKEEKDLKMRDIITSSWTNFATTGNPTPPGSNFIWEKATKDNAQQLNLTPNPVMEPYDILGTRLFWATENTRINQNLIQ